MLGCCQLHLQHFHHLHNDENSSSCPRLGFYSLGDDTGSIFNAAITFYGSLFFLPGFCSRKRYLFSFMFLFALFATPVLSPPLFLAFTPR